MSLGEIRVCRGYPGEACSPPSRSLSALAAAGGREAVAAGRRPGPAGGCSAGAPRDGAGEGGEPHPTGSLRGERPGSSPQLALRALDCLIRTSSSCQLVLVYPATGAFL
ncbi:unnamed protein product [Effrenium voratum]|nr:unnamed protein product [Effrenium voratum]